MKTTLSVFAAVSFILLTCITIETASGQSANAANAPSIGPQSNIYRPARVDQVSSAAKIVGYRTTDWQTILTTSSDEADQTIATLERIGCKVEMSNQGEQIEIRFHCPDWHSMKVKTHSLQTQWASWCENQGLEIVVVNPPTNSQRPTVMFKMTQPRTVHLHDDTAAQKILNTLTLIGCNIKTTDHDGHTDATFDCFDWKTIELASKDSAQAWLKWLKESGFETQHEHVNTNDGSATRDVGSAVPGDGSSTRRSAAPARNGSGNSGSSNR